MFANSSVSLLIISSIEVAIEAMKAALTGKAPEKEEPADESVSEE